MFLHTLDQNLCDTLIVVQICRYEKPWDQFPVKHFDSMDIHNHTRDIFRKKYAPVYQRQTYMSASSPQQQTYMNIFHAEQLGPGHLNTYSAILACVPLRTSTLDLRESGTKYCCFSSTITGRKLAAISFLIQAHSVISTCSYVWMWTNTQVSKNYVSQTDVIFFLAEPCRSITQQINTVEHQRPRFLQRKAVFRW